MVAPHSAKAVANYFLDKANEDGRKISPMKLQKLVYFAHGWHLAVRGTPLIDETIEAWRYGPVISSLYHEFKSNGAGPIVRHARELDWPDDSDSPVLVEPSIDENDRSIVEILDLVWSSFKDYSAGKLSAMTHIPDSPWAEVYHEGLPKGTDISDQKIQSYFVSIAEDDPEQQSASG